MKKSMVISLALLAVLMLFIAACSNSTSTEGNSKQVASTASEQPPIITGFSPPWQEEGSAITISGANFDTTSINNTVTFNGTKALVASATATTLAVIVPAGATLGPVTVTTAKGTATSSTSFVVMVKGGASPPVITDFTPNAGNVGAVVTLTGSNFYAEPENNIVTFNGTRARVISATGTSLTVEVPDAVSGNLTVTTPGGTKISSKTFALISPDGTAPVIKGFTPLRASAGSSVAVSGRNFDATAGNNIVHFNGKQAQVINGSATMLAVTVPAGATSGPITVSNSAGFARSAASFAVTGSGGGIAGLMGGAIQGNNLALTKMALTIAGGGTASGLANGTGTEATFNNPNGITADATNLYIADSGNRVIRKIEIATLKVTTLAGSGLLGATNATGLGAAFSTPNGITTDGSSLFVADSGNNRIRKITPLSGTLAAMTSDNAAVTTLAGSGSIGFSDATGTAATFKAPYGITTDGVNLYVADGSNRIRRIVIATGAVTTLAGSGSAASADGNGAAASFNRPRGITISPDHSTLYVTDSGSNVIRKIVIATRDVTTIAGADGSYGSMDGIGAAASFRNPSGIATDGTNLYIADAGNQKIRQIALAGLQVSTLAGSGTAGDSDNVLGSAATLLLPNGVTVAGSYLYVSDSGNNLVRRVALSATQEVKTIAGKRILPSNNPVGTGTTTKFNFPYGITTDGTNLFVADSGDRSILKIVISSGVVTRLAGSGYSGSINATGGAASFNYPMGVTTDGVYVYVADAESHKIRQIVISSGVVTTLAGSGAYGSGDATGPAATFSQPFGITMDGTNLYVADSGSNKIRKIVIATGEVSTLAGSGVAGADDAIGSAASFKHPTGITTDGTNLYVADTGNNKIRKIVISSGTVSTLAGTGLYWNDDLLDSISTIWNGPDASFRSPSGITTDGTNLYVADSDNNQIRKIEIASGKVTTLVGSGAFGSTDGTGTEASFSQPVGITTDGTSLYTTEYLNNLIRKIQ